MRPPSLIVQKLELVMGYEKQSPSDIGVSYHIPQLLAPLLYESGQKAFSFRRLTLLTPLGALPLDSTGGCTPDPRYRLTLIMVCPLRKSLIHT